MSLSPYKPTKTANHASIAAILPKASDLAAPEPLSPPVVVVGFPPVVVVFGDVGSGVLTDVVGAEVGRIDMVELSPEPGTTIALVRSMSQKGVPSLFWVHWTVSAQQWVPSAHHISPRLCLSEQAKRCGEYDTEGEKWFARELGAGVISYIGQLSFGGGVELLNMHSSSPQIAPEEVGQQNFLCGQSSIWLSTQLNERRLLAF